eukprot:29586-Pelagococcus_subviridis.AAC.9
MKRRNRRFPSLVVEISPPRAVLARLRDRALRVHALRLGHLVRRRVVGLLLARQRALEVFRLDDGGGLLRGRERGDGALRLRGKDGRGGRGNASGPKRTSERVDEKVPVRRGAGDANGTTRGSGSARAPSLSSRPRRRGRGS